MRKPEKLLLFAVSLAGFGFSAVMLSLFYPIPVITDTVAAYRAFYPWLDNVFAGGAAFTCICFFLLLLVSLFFPDRPREMELAKSKGRLRFSKQAVESTISYSFAGMDGVNFSRVRAKIGRRPEKTRVYVRLSLNDPASLAELTETIQDKIASALESSLGITAKTIDIRTVELKTSGEARKDASADLAKTGRVV